VAAPGATSPGLNQHETTDVRMLTFAAEAQREIPSGR
jgi:hypothetical protein